MSKQLQSVDPDLAAWIGRQKIFFVGTAPLSAEHHVNISPKGGDSFRLLGPLEAAYQDYVGSGAETVAHVRENGRLVIMFCAFEGAPRIVRLHGRGRVIAPGMPDYEALAAKFPNHRGARALIHLRITRVSSSCGFAVPFFDYRSPRDVLDKWCDAKSDDEIERYRDAKNRVSIDGLAAFQDLGG